MIHMPTLTALQIVPAASTFALLGVQGRSSAIVVEIALSMRRRLRGWLGRRFAPVGRGLWLLPCDAVHTFAMRFPVDLVFADAGGRVLRIHRSVPAWRVRVCIGAYSVLELPAGEADDLGLMQGDHLELRGA